MAWRGSCPTGTSGAQNVTDALRGLSRFLCCCSGAHSVRVRPRPEPLSSGATRDIGAKQAGIELDPDPGWCRCEAGCFRGDRDGVNVRVPQNGAVQAERGGGRRSLDRCRNRRTFHPDGVARSICGRPAEGHLRFVSGAHPGAGNGGSRDGVGSPCPRGYTCPQRAALAPQRVRSCRGEPGRHDNRVRHGCRF